jgi:hypothetical protein
MYSSSLSREGVDGEEAVNESLLSTVLGIVGAGLEAVEKAAESLSALGGASGQTLDSGLLGSLRRSEESELLLGEAITVGNTCRCLELKTHGGNELLESGNGGLEVSSVGGGLDSGDGSLLTDADDNCGLETSS